jgi:hypothetical protein
VEAFCRSQRDWWSKVAHRLATKKHDGSRL